jgi:hypothetical protein
MSRTTVDPSGVRGITSGTGKLRALDSDRQGDWRGSRAWVGHTVRQPPVALGKHQTDEERIEPMLGTGVCTRETVFFCSRLPFPFNPFDPFFL